MNNRYLFKAKRLDNGEWIQGYLYGIWERKYILWGMTNDMPNMVEVDSTTICRCTGLADCNGNLIWENDIVSFIAHTDKGVIKNNCASFGIVYKTCINWARIEANIFPLTGCNNSLYACENDNFISLWEIYWNFNEEDNLLSTLEVLGNIFDNKNLLESEN